MKQFLYNFFSLYFLVLLTSCTNNLNSSYELFSLNNSIITHYKDTITVKPSPTQPRELPQGYSYGCYNNRNSNGVKSEENLVRQFDTYVSGLMMGDLEACKKYTFKDAVRYHKEQFPNYSEERIWNEYFRDMGKVDLASSMAAEHDIEMRAVIPKFYTKVSKGDEIFVAFGSSITCNFRKFYILQDNLEHCIAYSPNNGLKWEFITVNEDTQEILSFKCDGYVIAELLRFD